MNPPLIVRKALLAGLAVSGIAGCAETKPETGWAGTVRDSAGIEIVENARPAWAGGEAWRVSEEPVLTIGVAAGAEEYELFDVVAALRVRDGGIAVACGGTREIRFYDFDGKHRRSIGQEGGGPGEFRFIMDMWHMGPDSLVVFDYGNARLTVLSGHGEFGRTIRLGQVPGRALPLPAGPFGDGSFLGKTHMLGTEQEVPKGVHRGTVLFVRWSSVGELVDTLVSRPDSERYHGTVAGEPIMASPPFGRDFSVAASTDRWYYGSMEAFDVEMYSPEGRLGRIIRRDIRNRAITPEMKEQRRRWALERYGRLPAPVRDWRVNLPVPETTPAHGRFAIDDEGNLWVAEYRLPTEQPSWAVFDPEGWFLGVVETPAQGSVTHIGTDFILGVWHDEMDVEQVKMYRLIKVE